jgi:glycolate oxidase iron-sulfur subunit
LETTIVRDLKCMDDQELEQKLTMLDAWQSTCTDCGLCQEACVTFQASGWEHESPRGRLHLAGQLLHGHIQPQAPALKTFDRCLACQACEMLCPSQVPYRRVRQIVQELRAQLTLLHSSSLTRAEYRRWVTLVHRVGKLWWRHYFARRRGSLMKRYQRPLPQVPVLAVCCVQDLVQHEVIEQTLAFMQALGYPLQIDKKQPCCGALFERLIQGGEETVCYPQEQQRARKLQQRAVHAFLNQIEGITLREVSQPFACCGGYCGESILHPHHAQTLADHQLKCLPPTATVIVTSPDCWHTFATYSTQTLLYPIQLFIKAKLVQL